MNRLPLVAAQPGIWMAEQLSTLPNAWSVAHYTELKGDIDAPLLAKAIAAGMMQADTLRMRFAEDNGEAWQWVDDTFILPEPSIVRVDGGRSQSGSARGQRSAARFPSADSGR